MERIDAGLREVVPPGDRPEPVTWLERAKEWVRAEQPQTRADWDQSHHGVVEDPEAGVVGICCSGGGIRSAAFNLGALQRLQEEGVLERAHYLAAVSGGSYIASAFSIVLGPRSGPDDEPSEAALFRGEYPAPFAPGSPEEQYLRNRTGYLAPNGMAAFVLFWRLLVGAFATFLLVAGRFGLVAFAVLAPVVKQFYYDDGATAFGVPCAVYWVVAVLLGLAIVTGVFSMKTTKVKWEGAREVWAARFLIAAGVGAALFIGLPELHNVITESKDGVSPGASRFGFSTATLTFLGGVFALVRESLYPPAKKEEGEKSSRFTISPKLGSRLRLAFAYAAGAVAGPLLIAGLAYVCFSRSLSTNFSPWTWVIVVFVGVCYGLAYARIDLTALSLHRFYKRRLCSAFSLKRTEENSKIKATARDYIEPVKLSQSAFNGRKLEGKGWPTLLICAAANVSDEGATPRGREVTSFTFSAGTVGGPLVGGVKTKELEQWYRSVRRGRDVTVPAAIAMSGAALAPSMGKLTKKPFRFLLALTNVRLGVWVPNPSWVDNRLKEQEAKKKFDKKKQTMKASEATESGANPEDEADLQKAKEDYKGLRTFVTKRPNASYLIRELLGRNYRVSPYLYVTDGGHYENLGLVELLRRGCTEIYCFDASAGRDADELGDAIALARSELGVEVDIDPRELVGLERPESACVLGTVAYAEDPELPGWLYYCRNVMPTQPSWDVEAVASRDPAFPDDSTADQLLAEQRFEAYRKLGWDAAGDAIAVQAPD